MTAAETLAGKKDGTRPMKQDDQSQHGPHAPCKVHASTPLYTVTSYYLSQIRLFSTAGWSITFIYEDGGGQVCDVLGFTPSHENAW
jgi:hypothetical protein